MANKDAIVAGIDTHCQTHHVALVTLTGAAVADKQFVTTKAGNKSISGFLTAHGPVARVGV
ncbi:MAG: hypothetical protein LBU05_07475 [Bifidobacteriaceae bacterium]|jgi:hypothetical protein|nr:hypothetical protein [Bifidobacteriaceae bacterium]